MTTIPKGGRGHKVSYESQTVRVPLPILDKVQEFCNAYRESVVKGENQTFEKTQALLSEFSEISLTKDEVIAEAHKILKGRRNARISLEKLLRLLYNDSNINL
jgi:hypothetical protein